MTRFIIAGNYSKSDRIFFWGGRGEEFEVMGIFRNYLLLYRELLKQRPPVAE